MIQRIQTIYLLLAGLIPAFALFQSLLVFTTTEGGVLKLTGLGYEGTLADGRFPWGVCLLTIILALASLATIFYFRNRKKQIGMVNGCIGLALAWYVTLGCYGWSILRRLADVEMEITISAILPAFSLVLLILARRGIKKDEALVRAAERIR